MSFSRHIGALGAALGALGALAAAGVALGLYSYCSSNETPGETKRKHYSDWMRWLSGYKLITEVNLPGTHDSAAIALRHTSKLDRQCHSITEQLLKGIRVLDVRIAIEVENNRFIFNTTHGANSPHYQSLTSLLDECKEFLRLHRSEYLILNLQIDDGTPSPDALASLVSVLNPSTYPLLAASSTPPNVTTARGKMLLLNRINENYALGLPLMQWARHQNCDFLQANEASDSCRIFVQDKYTNFKTHNKDVIAKKKFKLYLSALEKFTEAYHTSEHGGRDVLINYASVSDNDKVVNMKPLFLNHMGCGEQCVRPNRLGWVMFDFPWDTVAKTADGEEVTVVDCVILSNFKYKGLPFEFSYVRE